jgi:hypothetical protein
VRARACFVAAALVVVGCKSKAKPAEWWDENEVMTDPLFEPPITPIAPGGATREAREKAVLAVMGGKLPAKSAELAATDPGVAFDLRLRVALTSPRREPWQVEVDAKAVGVDEAAGAAFVARARPYFEACAGHGSPVVMRENRHVVVTVKLGEGGAVTDAKRTSMDVFDSTVLECIDAKLRRFKVEGAPPGSKLELTLRFAPRSESTSRDR